MSLRQRFVEQVDRGRQGDSRELEQLIAEEPGVVRHLLGMTYHPESDERMARALSRGVSGRRFR